MIADEFTTFRHLRYDDNGGDEPVQSNEVHTRFHRTENYTWVNAVHEVPNFIPTEKYPNEVGVDTISGKVVIGVDPKYYRPTEVETLLGNSQKARTELGWQPTYSFVDLVREMCENET